MSMPVIQMNTNKAGLCPHGLPFAACPICSGGMAGGGGKSVASKPMKSNQWSYMKCYAEGMAIKAREKIELSHKDFFEKSADFAKKMQQSINNLAERIRANVETIRNMLPDFLKPAFNAVNNLIINPILNLISKIPNVIEKFANFMKDTKNLIQNAGEKIVALLGDIKNFIDRKIVEKIKKSIKKIFLFFVSNTEDENYQNDEQLAVFKSREIKKFLVKLLKEKERNKNADRDTARK